MTQANAHQAGEVGMAKDFSVPGIEDGSRLADWISAGGSVPLLLDGFPDRRLARVVPVPCTGTRWLL